MVDYFNYSVQVEQSRSVKSLFQINRESKRIGHFSSSAWMSELLSNKRLRHGRLLLWKECNGVPVRWTPYVIVDLVWPGRLAFFGCARNPVYLLGFSMPAACMSNSNALPSPTSENETRLRLHSATPPSPIGERD